MHILIVTLGTLVLLFFPFFMLATIIMLGFYSYLVGFSVDTHIINRSTVLGCRNLAN